MIQLKWYIIIFIIIYIHWAQSILNLNKIEGY